MTEQRSFGPFAGLYTTLDRAMIPDGMTPDAANVTVPDGRISLRNGYVYLTSAPSSYHSALGGEYLNGYDSSDDEVREQVVFYKVGSTVKPYSISVDSPYTRTEIGSGLSLHNSLWRGFAFRDMGYFYNPNESPSVFRHELGTAASWTQKNNPETPTSKLTVVAHGTGGASPPDDSNATVAWTGWAGTSDGTVAIDSPDATPPALTTTSIATVVDGQLKIYLNYLLSTVTGVGNHPAVLECDEAWLVNADGKKIVPARVERRLIKVGGDELKINVGVFWDTKTYADWDDIRYLWVKVRAGWAIDGFSATAAFYTKDYYFKFDVRTMASGSADKDWQDYYNIFFTINYTMAELIPLIDYGHYLTFSKLTFGGAPLASNDEGRPPRPNVEFAYTLYDSVAQLEGEMSPARVLTDLTLDGPLMPVNRSSGAPRPTWGRWLTISSPSYGGVIANQWRLYVKIDDAEGWRYISTQNLGTSVTIPKAWSEYTTAKPDDTQFDRLGQVVCATPFKSWVVWGYQGGYQNLKHSRIGEPERLAMEDETPREEDLNRAATFSMAPNFGDDPISLHECGDALIACGGEGVYAQAGDAPWSMTPPRKLAKSHGVAGPMASARYHDDNGNVGVAYVDKHGDGVHFASAAAFVSGNRDEETVELSRPIRGLVREWLLGQTIDGSAPSIADVVVCVHEALDALYVILGQRCLVLTKASDNGAGRQWLKHSWSMGTYTPNGGSLTTEVVKYAIASTKHELRLILNSGRIIQVERAPGGATVYDGATPDGSRARPDPYYYTKAYAGANRRADRVTLYKEDLTDPIDVTCVGDRQTSTVSVAADRRHARFGFKQQGWTLQYKIDLENDSSPIEGMVVQERRMGGRPLA